MIIDLNTVNAGDTVTFNNGGVSRINKIVPNAPKNPDRFFLFLGEDTKGSLTFLTSGAHHNCREFDIVEVFKTWPEVKFTPKPGEILKTSDGRGIRIVGVVPDKTEETVDDVIGDYPILGIDRLWLSRFAKAIIREARKP